MGASAEMRSVVARTAKRFVSAPQGGYEVAHYRPPN